MDIKKRKKMLLKLIPPIKELKIAKAKEIESQMNSLVWSYKKDDNPPALAYITRNGKAESYKVFVSDFLKEAELPLKLHEFGHAIYQHLKIEKFTDEMVKTQVRAKWKQFKKNINIEKDDVESDVSAEFIGYLKNMAFDMEVNSKVFTEEEYDKVDEVISNAVLIQKINEAQTDAELDFYENYLNTEDRKQFARGVHPNRFGFPSGLNWSVYIKLMLRNPDKFMQDMQNNFGENDSLESGMQQNTNEQQQRKQQNSSCQQDNEGEKGNNYKKEKSDSDDSGGNKKNDSENNGSKEDSQKEKKLKGSFFKKANKRRDVDNGDIVEENEGIEENGAYADEYNTGRYSRYGTGMFSFEKITSEKLSDRLRKFIEKNAIASIKVESHPDVLYNFNRGKSKQVLRPKTVSHAIYRPANVYVLLDISSSVDLSLARTAIEQLMKFKNKFGPKSRLVLWDTTLKGDFKFFDKQNLNKLYVGGGTDISGGINYISQYINGIDDKLFIISDYEDYLKYWAQSLLNVKCDYFGISWESQKNTQKILEKSYNYCDAAEKVALTKLKTFCVF